MGSKQIDEGSGMAGLQVRIEGWRKTRLGHERMPESLWSDAVKYAQSLGASRVSRTLGIDYIGLRRRLSRLDENIVMVTETDGGGFVELGLNGAWSGPSIVEVKGKDNSQLLIRVAPGCTIDVASIVSAFMSYSG